MRSPAGVAQLVAHPTCNRAVRGSSPLAGSRDTHLDLRIYGYQVGQPGNTDAVHTFVFSRDGHTLFTLGDTIQSWNVTDPAKPTPVSQTLPSSGNWLTFSPDGHTLLTGENGQTIRIWDLHY